MFRSFRTLVHDPSVLLMDEPFGALDALTRLQVRMDLEALWLRRRPTVLFITHSVEEAVGLSDRILVMSPSPGEVVEEIKVDLPRPAPIVLGDAPEFGAYVDRIHRHFERMGVLHGVDVPVPSKTRSVTRMTTSEASNATSREDSRPLVSVAFNGMIAEVAIDNGPINLVTKAMLRALNGVLIEVAARTEVRCLILHGGEARAFCAGSDIKEFSHLRKDASEHKILFEDMVLRHLAHMPMPTIAAIDGPALGGGLELALACDLRVSKRGAVMGLTESRLGGLAGNGALRLTRLVGPARAKQMLFTGETVSDDQALAWGLVNRVVDRWIGAGWRAGTRGHHRRARAGLQPARQGARGRSPGPSRSTPDCRCRQRLSSRYLTAAISTKA